MEFTAQQISDLLQGAIDGDPEVKVSNLSRIEDGAPGTLSFLANPKYTDFLYSTKASIVIVSKEFIPEREFTCTLIRVKDAYASFARLLEIYNQIVRDKKGIETGSHISESAELGKEIYVGSGAYVGNRVKVGDYSKIYPQVYLGDNVLIGSGTTIYPGVKIYSDCIIGSNVTLHSGVVIGADGFGFAPSTGNYKKVPQIGNVIIEDHVEIGAGTTIDRATLGSTVIRRGVKLDNLIQIAHNVEIGENTVIAAQTGIAGSTKIGRDCMIGGQVGIVGHITIADGTKIAAQSGIGSDIKDTNTIVQGSPAFPIGDFRRTYVVYKKLPEIEKRIQLIENRIEENDKK